MNLIWIVLLIVLTFVLVLVFIYNNLTKKRILVQEGWSGISTFLQQRHDLLPNLVETVKGYTLHESKTLADIIAWRNKGMNAGTHAEKLDAESGLGKSLGAFFALAEQYPDLKANTNFLNLQEALQTLETGISQSRRYYNGTVRTYNQAIAVFPSNLVAMIFGFRSEPFFQEEAAAQQIPKVSLS